MNRNELLLYGVVSFLLGSLPFSLWVGRIWLGKDIRAFGDHNPGATNVLRAGGKGPAILAATLDVFKAAIPTGMAWLWLGVTGWPMALIAVAPIAGHAFSPLLGWRGGKAVAATFGTWAGLTVWEGPTILGLSLLVTTRILRHAWAVLASMCLMLAWLVFTPPDWNGLGVRPPQPLILAAWTLNLIVLIAKHRAELHLPFRDGPADDRR